jgi:hypothetical protein
MASGSSRAAAVKMWTVSEASWSVETTSSGLLIIRRALSRKFEVDFSGILRSV